MTLRRFVEAGGDATVFYVLTASAAAAACCEHAEATCRHTAKLPCCDTANEPAAVAVLIPQVPAPRPAREMMAVLFMKPVLVGTRVLLGNYVIEHDNDRMARGEPCTYIYAADDLRHAVVAFRCEHLHRPRVEQASVTVSSMFDPFGMQKIREFQFAGEAVAHGVPNSR